MCVNQSMQEHLINSPAPAPACSMIVVTAAYSMSQHIENLTRTTTTSYTVDERKTYTYMYISTATAGVGGWESNGGGGRVKCLDARAPSWRTWFHPVAHAPLPTSNLSLYTLDTHTQIHNTHTHRRRRCVWLCVFIDEWSASRNGAGQRQVERVGGPHVSNQNDEAVTVSTSSLPCCCWMVFHRAVISLQDQQ
jgi:hypothetical protein